MGQNSSRRVRDTAYVIVFSLVGWACQPSYPEGTIPCATEQECPEDWFCEQPEDSSQHYCFKRPIAKLARRGPAAPSGMDAMPEVAPSPDAGQQLDAGTGPRDAGQPPQPAADGGRPSERSEQLPFSVFMTTPGDGERLVDPTGSLWVLFSAAVDTKSVNETTFKVMLGERTVNGKFAVRDDEVSFKPDARWQLSARYTVELTQELRDRALRALKPRRWSFRVRAGEWSMQRISALDAATDRAPRLAVSSQGHAALAWSVAQGESRVFRRTRDGDWSELSALAGAAHALAIDNAGRIAVAVDSSVMLYEEMPEPRLLLPATDLKKLLLTESHELHVLFVRDGRLVQVDRALTSEQTSEIVHSAQVQPSAADLAQFRGSWFATWTQPEAVDGGIVQSIWATDNPQRDSQPSSAREVSSAQSVTGPPAIASDGERALVAVWHKYDLPEPRVFATVRTEATMAWGDSYVISDVGTGAKDPRIAIVAQDCVMVVWLQTAGVGARVVGRAYDPTKTFWTPPVTLSGDSMHFAKRVVVAANATGQALAVWAQASSGDSALSDTIRYAVYAPETGWSGTPLTLVEDGQIESDSLSVGVADDGRAFAAWLDADEVWVGRLQ